MGDKDVKISKDGKLDKRQSECEEWTVYKYRWVMLLCYCLLTSSIHSGSFIFTSSSHVTQRYYHVGVFFLNMLDIIYELMVIPFALPSSYVTSQHGVRLTLIIAAGLNLAGAIIRFQGKIPTAYQLLLVGSIPGACAMASILSLPPRIAGLWFSESERGLATGIAVAADSAGMILGFLESSEILKNPTEIPTIAKNLQSLLMTQVVHATIVGVIVFLLARDQPPSPPSTRRARESKKPIIKGERKLSEAFSLIENEDANDYEAEEAEEETSKLQPFELFNPTDKSQSFFDDLKLLLCHSSFMTIVMLHTAAHLVESTFTTFLNELLIVKFPNHRKLISIMAIVGIATGVVGNIGVGYLLKWRKCYKTLTFLLFIISSSCLLLFGVLYFTVDHFYLIFVVVVVGLMSSMSYYTVAFEEAAYVSAQVSESTSGMILILSNGSLISLFAGCTSKVLGDYGAKMFFVTVYILFFGMLAAATLLRMFQMLKDCCVSNRGDRKPVN